MNAPLKSQIAAPSDSRSEQERIAEALEAVPEILRASGREFDPKVVDALIGTVRRVEAEHGDVVSYLARDSEDYDYIASRRRLRRASEAAR